MAKSKKQDGKADSKSSGRKIARADDPEAEVDALFKLPLAEFTGARNTLSARLKQSGRGDQAVRVKALAKPPVSAWAVNQLYWNHRQAFERLLASGERFHRAQTSRHAGKIADMRAALEARREALTQLSDLATSLLRTAGQNPSLDTLRRITTTLEAMSAYASRSDAPRPGCLTGDVDPPGFESFASFVPGMRPAPSAPAGVTQLTTTDKRRKLTTDHDQHRLAEARKVKLAAAKASLQETKRSLTKARARAQSLAAAQKQAEGETQQAEKLRRAAESSLEKAKAALEAATRRARSIATEVEESASALEAAERSIAEADKELESLVRESSGR